MRTGDAAAVRADRAHHLELLVHDHEELFGLFGRLEELRQRLDRRAAVGVTERARDRVHRHDAVARAHVRLRARAHRDMPRRHDREGPVRAALVLEQSPEPGQGCRARHPCPRPRGEIPPDHEVRAFAEPDLVGDHAPDDLRRSHRRRCRSPRRRGRSERTATAAARRGGRSPPGRGRSGSAAARRRRGTRSRARAPVGTARARAPPAGCRPRRSSGMSASSSTSTTSPVSSSTVVASRAMSANGTPRAASSIRAAGPASVIGASGTGRAVAMKRKNRPRAVCDLGTRTHRLGGGPPGEVRVHAVTISDERMPEGRLRIGSEFRRPPASRTAARS